MGLRTALNLLVLFLIFSLDGMAQEGDVAPLDPAQMEKLWEAYNAVGPQHQFLQKQVGKWKTVTQEFMMNPANPTVSEGTAEFTSVLGGRFVVQHFKGMSQGRPFEGMGWDGYDNAKQKFVGTWIDTMGTGLMTSEGTYDPSTKTVTHQMEMSSPMGPMKLRATTEHKSDKEFVMTMYMVSPTGQEAKAMVVTYTKM